MTQQDQRKKTRPAQGSFGPAQHTRGKPIAGQKCELREPRFHQQTVEHRQHSRFEHLVGDRLGPQPERRADEHQQRQRHRSHLKRPPIQVTGDVDRQPRARNGRQDDEKRHQHHRGQVKMPRDTVAETVSGEQRRDQKEKRPRSQQRRFHEFPAEDRLRRHGQREQEGRFAIAEEIGVADHQIAEQQQNEQEGEQKKHQPLDQQCSETGEVRDEFQSPAKQPEGQHDVADDEKADQGGEQAGLFAEVLHPAPRLQRVDADQQAERRGEPRTGARLTRRGWSLDRDSHDRQCTAAFSPAMLVSCAVSARKLRSSAPS